MRSESLLKACFDEMRVHKEQEKVIKTTIELYDTEIPRREAAEAMILKVSHDDGLRFKT